MSDKTMETVVLALLGAGGATFIWTVVRSYLAIRNSAEVREDKAVARLEKYEADCRSELAFERRVSGYWRRLASIYEHSLLINGVTIPDVEPPPDYPRGPH